jgi:hypothetical protein
MVYDANFIFTPYLYISPMKKFIACSSFVFISTFIFSQNLFPFLRSGSWGFIDSTGKEIIAPKYKVAGFFMEGFALVQTEKGVGYIDKNDKVVIEDKYQNGYNFNEGYVTVMEDEDWGLINAKGEMVIPAKYAKPLMVYDGMIKFKQERGLFSTYGFMNTKGDTVIYPKYERAGDFSNGLCMASTDGGKFGYIDKKGNWVIQPIYEIGVTLKINDEYDYTDRAYSDGYVAIDKNDKYGLMDKTGKMVLDAKFDWLGKYSEGLIPAKKDTLYGFIDLKGNWVIKPEYNSAEAFYHGLAAVSKGPYDEEHWGFINHAGKVIIPITIHANYSPYVPMRFLDGLVPCLLTEESFGYVNREGKIVWSMD